MAADQQVMRLTSGGTTVGRPFQIPANSAGLVEVLERRINGRPVFAAVFPGLRAGDYDIWENAPNPSGTVTIVRGEVATVDWR